MIDELHTVSPSLPIRDADYYRERHYRRKLARRRGPKRVTAKLLAEGCCRLCRRTAEEIAEQSPKHPRLTRHHLIPKRAGGRDHRHNIVPLCRSCHDDVDKREWRKRMENRARLRAVLTTHETAYLVMARSDAWLDRHYPADMNAWIGMTEPPDDWDED